MTVLITGGAGYVGAHIAHAAVDAGRDVVILDNLSTGKRSNAPGAARLIEGDLADADLLADIFAGRAFSAPISAVVHCAASTSVAEAVGDPVGYYRNNAVNALNLIEAAMRGGAESFVFSSTAAVYGEPRTDLIDENHPTEPATPYGASKLMAERMLRDAAAVSPMRYAILRYFNVAGADPKGRAGQTNPDARHVIKMAADAALGRIPRFEIFGDDYDTPDGTCIRDFIHVSDLAEAHIEIIRYLEKGGPSDTFNCGNARGYSVREVAEEMRRTSKRNFEIKPAPRRQGDIPKVIANPKKITRKTNWKPKKPNLKTMIQNAIKWEIKQK